MHCMFLTENPFLSGYSFLRSTARRCRVFLPQPSASWLFVGQKKHDAWFVSTKKDNLGSFPCLILFVQFLVSYRRLLASICKENANECKESLLSICRVQLFFCKDTTFPRNFQGFGEKCRDGDNAKRRLSELRVACWILLFRWWNKGLFILWCPNDLQM